MFTQVTLVRYMLHARNFAEQWGTLMCSILNFMAE